MIFMIQTIYNSMIVNRRYPYIKTEIKYEVDKITKNQMIKNVKVLFLYKIGI